MIRRFFLTRRMAFVLAAALILCMAGCKTSLADPILPAPPGRGTASPSPSDKPAASPSPDTDTPAPEPDFSTRDIKIQMAGDILLHTKPVGAAKTGAHTYDFTPYFSEIKDYIDGDLAICNMESPVDAYGDNQNLSSFPLFNVPYEILPALKGAGFNFLLTANNHAYDKKFAGLAATRNNIEKAGLRFTGTFETREQYDEPVVIDIDGLKVGILNYSDADNGMGVTIPADKLPFAMRRFTVADMSSIPAMTADIARLREAGAEFVIAALHWGAEYLDKPNDTQKKIAQALCDGGADVVMGSHAHCVQPIEWHEAEDGRTCLILYSLGNFFADQIGMSPPKPKTQYGMLASVTIRKNKAGEIEWAAADYLPTLTYRYADKSSPNGYGYRLLPSEAYVEGEVRPAIFAGDAEWEKARTAYAHVTNIAGDAVAVADIH